MTYKLIVAGSRDFEDYSVVKEAIRLFLRDNPIDGPVQIVSGGAQGVDRLGERYARDERLNLRVIPAQWKLYGRSAGPLRNKAMADYADGLVAVWDGVSKGTDNMINTAIRKGLDIYVHTI